MNFKRVIHIAGVLLFILIFSSCKKYLDAPTGKGIRTLTSLADGQAMLDYYYDMSINYTDLPELIADNLYFSSADWASFSLTDRSDYIWGEDPDINSWHNAYLVVYYSNTVLEALPKVKDASNETVYKDVKGQALFHRSFALYQLAQLYCRPYSASATSDPGLPLRMRADLDEVTTRSTVQQTYDLIINNLEEAAALLPETVVSAIRPNKAAAYGALARTYLSMRDYVKAGSYADSVLKRGDVLMDFNQLNANAITPIGSFNPETIFYAGAVPGTVSPPYNVKIDSTLYNSYDNNDLRKTVFFRKNADNVTYSFKGSYDGTRQNYAIFYGITTDEMYLIRAECSARAGLKDSALADLNRLMVKRWKNDGSFIPFSAVDADAAKNIILTERRKELVFRGLRWMDVRRLNEESAGISLQRILDGTTYTLSPDDLRWVLLVPWKAVDLGGVSQAPR